MPKLFMLNKKNVDIIRLKHIRDACREAGDFIAGKKLFDLKDNRMLALSLVKEIEIIGEAAAKISGDFKKKHDQLPWEIMAATRHRLMHGYFDIDLEIIWQTVTNDLPGVLEAADDLIEELEE